MCMLCLHPDSPGSPNLSFSAKRELFDFFQNCVSPKFKILEFDEAQKKKYEYMKVLSLRKKYLKTEL
jgi:hypothetical protein